MKRSLVGLAVIACLAFAGSAQPAPVNGGGAASAIGKELAKEGAKAAIAHFAPELEEKIDPTAAGIRAIRDQLAALDAKLSQMQQHQEYLASRQLCATHVGTLRQIVSRARTSLEELIAATTLPDRAAREQRLDPLWRDRAALATDQDQLHTTLMDGAINACGQNFQDAMYPFFTAQLAADVHDWYATYHAAAVALLTVRLNLYRYAGPTGTLKQVTTTDANGNTETLQVPVRQAAYTEAEAEALARKVAGSGGWLDQEAAKIKPAFPYTESVDLAERLVFKTRVYPEGLQNTEAYRLFQQGWQASARDDPRCLQMTRVFAALKVPQSAVRTTLRQRGILDLTSPAIRCRDTHGDMYAYDVDIAKYEPTTSFPQAGTVLAHQLDGFLNLAPWSYK